jgi:GT2 family glycosyltransferase
MSRIAVVVVNHNDAGHLRACLASMPPGTEAVVVDNASSDGSAEMVRREFPAVLVIADGTNPGYGAAANEGVRATGAEHVLILNSDTRLEPGALEALHAYLERHPRVALVGPRLKNPDGSPQASVFPFPGTLRWLVENEPLSLVAGWIPTARRRLYRFSPPREPGPVPWVLGAVLAVRRAAFDGVGGFDDSVFLYYEEVDLCERLRRAGWEVHHHPGAAVVHRGGACTAQIGGEAAVAHFRSTYWFYRRYYLGWRLRAWLTMMRAKMYYRLMRDVLGSALAADALRRSRHRGRAAAWRRALRQVS